jgi:outer membrane immunogenic protein
MPYFGNSRALRTSQGNSIWGPHMRIVLYTSVAVVLLISPMTAGAADMPVTAAPPPVPPPFSWTGFYIGANLGGAWAHNTWSDSIFGVNFGNGNGEGVFIVGGQVGFNYQVSNIVFGVESDFEWAGNNNSGSGTLVPVLNQTIQVTSNDTWISTVAARLGFAYDRVLFYAKAGGGWIGNNGFEINNGTTSTSITGSNSNTARGWLAGAGLEWAFNNNWSTQVEYDYLGLSSRTLTVPVGSAFLAGDTFTTTTSGKNIQMAKVGFNYRFNWGDRY